MYRIRTLAALVVAAILPAWLAGTVSAQQTAPQAGADGQALSLWTAFPAQQVSIGDDISLALKLRATGEPQVAQLETSELPADWIATFRGDNRAVESALIGT